MNKVFSKSDNFKSEYSCAVVRIGNLEPVEGSDFLAKTMVFGTQIVVRKDMVKTGDIMLYAANETQLDESFLSVNNLFEISCREKNSNYSEVKEIMDEYEPIKQKAEIHRMAAKKIKKSIEGYNKNANILNKAISKKSEKLNGLEAGTPEYDKLSLEIEIAKRDADNCIQRAMAASTKYVEEKNKTEELVQSGKHIVDKAKTMCGFFNKYGRVRCIVLKNTPSFGFLFSPESLIRYDSSITLEEIESYEGQEFDTVNEKLFVKVYIPPVKEEPVRKSNKIGKQQKKIKRFNRMVPGEFFFHYDTAQLEKEIFNIKPDDVVDISLKMHGTSVIIGKLQVKEPIKLPLFQRIRNMLIDFTGLLKKFRIQDYKFVYGPVFASRKVIKNQYINKEVNQGYYDKDIWSEYGNIIYPYLEEGMTVYGEICGYVSNESMIQKFYDYGCNKGENIIMFYRITTSTENGKREWRLSEVYDWTLKLVERMKENGDENWKKIHPIDILWHGTLAELYPDIDTEKHWHEEILKALSKDQEHFLMELNEPLCKNEVPREGLVIRIEDDKLIRAFKLKTMSFKLKEAILYDSGEVDVEAQEGYDIQ